MGTDEPAQAEVSEAGRRRVLVCGSRTWAGWGRDRAWSPTPAQRREAAVLAEALERLFLGVEPTPALVHGACPTGADAIADAWASRQLEHGVEIPIERYPAVWSAPCRPACRPGHRRLRSDGSLYCPAAGQYRNADMVESLAPGRDVVVAAWDGKSRGTAGTLRLAGLAGIEVVYIGFDAEAARAALDAAAPPTA